MYPNHEFDFSSSTDPKYRPVPLDRTGRVREEFDAPYFEVHQFYSERRRLNEKARFDELNEAAKVHESVKSDRETWQKFSKRERTLDRTVSFLGSPCRLVAFCVFNGTFLVSGKVVKLRFFFVVSLANIFWFFRLRWDFVVAGQLLGRPEVYWLGQIIDALFHRCFVLGMALCIVVRFCADEDPRNTLSKLRRVWLVNPGVRSKSNAIWMPSTNYGHLCTYLYFTRTDSQYG